MRAKLAYRHRPGNGKVPFPARARPAYHPRRVTDPTASSPAAAPGRRLLKLVGVAALALAVVAYGVRFCARGNDFLAFYGVGQVALQRGDIYAPSPTNWMWVFYAPHFSLLMTPFALLRVRGPLFALKIGALAWVARQLAARSTRAPPARRALRSGRRTSSSPSSSR